MISLEQILSVLRGELQKTDLIPMEEFKQLFDKVVNSKTIEEKIEKNTDAMCRILIASDNPMEAVAIYMMKNKMKEISKEDLVLLYASFNFIYVDLMEKVKNMRVYIVCRNSQESDWYVA